MKLSDNQKRKLKYHINKVANDMGIELKDSRTEKFLNKNFKGAEAMLISMVIIKLKI